MKIRALAVLLAAAAGVAATPASAQEEGSNFTGVRLEARAGWNSFGSRIGMTDPDDEDETIIVSTSRDKAGYGAELGYDYQLGPVVVGAFHPELTDDSRLHLWFLDTIVASREISGVRGAETR